MVSRGHWSVAVARWVGLPVAAVLCASLVRGALGAWLGPESPLLAYIGAVVVSAWIGGVASGVVAIVLSLLAGIALFVVPFKPEPFDAIEITRIAVFLTAGGLVIWSIASLRAARANADDAIADRALADRLRKLSDEAAETARARLELLADALPVLISYVDSEQRYRYNNRAYEQWFGEPRGMLHGKQIREVIGEPAYAAIRPHIETVLRGTGVEYNAEIPYRQAGLRKVRVMYIPDRADDGSVRGFFALILESERKLT